jgi:hypothetical protein
VESQQRNRHPEAQKQTADVAQKFAVFFTQHGSDPCVEKVTSVLPGAARVRSFSGLPTNRFRGAAQSPAVERVR